jgi:hypothetical protein
MRDDVNLHRVELLPDRNREACARRAGICHMYCVLSSCLVVNDDRKHLNRRLLQLRLEAKRNKISTLSEKPSIALLT